MDTQSKKELERLYRLAKSATATTNFYNQVYKYIDFIKQSPFLVALLEEDDKQLHIYDVQKHDDIPEQQKGENDFEYFLKRMKHMDSGAKSFVSHLYFMLNHHIYDLIDWHKTKDFQTEEASIMLNGKKKVTIADKLEKYLNRHKVIGYDNTDFNQKYINNFPFWKSLLNDFHKNLLEKIAEAELNTVLEQQGEIVLTLHTNGDFVYLKKKDNLNPKNDEYKLLYALIKAHKYTMSYEEIAIKIFGKIELASKPREEIRQLVKRLKRELGITSTTRHKLIESITNIGYHLVFQGDEQAIIVP